VKDPTIYSVFRTFTVLLIARVAGQLIVAVASG
jgi:hypothetical protein